MALESAAEYVAQSFEEFRWYNSHSLHAEELHCGICRLELPMSKKVAELSDDVFLTAFITSNQIPMHEFPITTRYAIKDQARNILIWDYVLAFPVKFRELSCNSMLLFTILTSKGAVVGGASLPLFNEYGAMHTGKQKLEFYEGKTADATTYGNNTSGDSYSRSAVSNFDFLFKMEKNLEEYRRKGFESTTEDSKTEWLDKLTLLQINYTLGNVASNVERKSSSVKARSMSESDPTEPVSSQLDKSERNSNVISSEHNVDVHFGRPANELEVLNRHFLVIEMPLLHFPVIHEEKPYLNNVSATSVLPTANDSIVTENDKGIFEFCIAGKEFSAQVLALTKDWEMDQDNIFEDQYRRLERDVLRGGSGGGEICKPNMKEKETIDAILSSTRNHLEYHEKDLLYRFRYSLTDNKKALTKFLLSVDWTSEVEVNEVPSLLNLWKTKAPIDVSDALKLLGREKAFQRDIVRVYAVDVLREAVDADLLMFLPQLVQALRYDSNMLQIAEAGSQNNEMSMQQGVNDLASSYAKVSLDASGVLPTPELNRNYSDGHHSNVASPLVNFLIERACANKSLANYLYWYLKVETEDDTGLGPMFVAVLDAFLRRLKADTNPDGSPGPLEYLARQLLVADDYVASVIRCQRASREEKGKKTVKELLFRKLLSEKKLTTISGRVNSIALPLDPSITVTGLNAEAAFMFTSALYPAVIEFSTVVEERTATGVVTVPSKMKAIFKSGDDLRQDQLIMQMFKLMDNLLRNVNLDLKLLTYGILATASADGLMELVTGSMAVSAVLKQYNNSIGAYLKHHHPDPSEPLGISAKCMDIYVKSCAGSCVISYILGIGDRHLDNVMMKSTGQLFHIDFGFVFGRDPKPFPPPFRFTHQMVDAMGGEESEHYAKFKTLCCQAFIWLRKSANLILSLLSLMGDAGIPDINVHSDLPTILSKVEERFRLDLNDEQAEQYFLGLIVETLNALAPKLMELAHQFAVARR